jgi:thiamine pyrophosphate-dependent acetolactate synthase large subunit-like protein
MKRDACTRLLAEKLTDEVVVTNLGQATLDMQQNADRPLNFYTFGSMGQTSAIAMGVALSRPDARVISLDGDGSMLMNLGQLCTVANTAPANLAIVVWDNEVHQTTGGQPTATSMRSSLAGVARGAGIEKVVEPQNEEEVSAAFDRILNEEGPFFVVVKVDAGPAAGSIARDLMGFKIRFMQALKDLPADRPSALVSG